MQFHILYDTFPLIIDVIDQYQALRRMKNSRTTAVRLLQEEFEQELSDDDDAISVKLGIAIALSQKKELTQEALDEAQSAISQLLQRADELDFALPQLHKLSAALSADKIGPEARYVCRKPYNPEWNVGDTFIHTITHPAAEKSNLYGWIAILRKVGEYTNHKNQVRQLVYVTVCPPDKIPQSDAELQALGYLRMMREGSTWDYLGQIGFTSRRDEDSWQLTKIGCFPNAGIPSDAAIENPLVSMPLFGLLRKNSKELDYEELICRIYRLRGIGR